MKTHYPVLWLPEGDRAMPVDEFIPAGLTAMSELLEGNFMLVFREAIDHMSNAVARIRFAFTTVRHCQKPDSSNYRYDLMGIDDAFTQITDGQVDFNRIDLSNPFDPLFDANIELFFDDFGIQARAGLDKFYLPNDQMYKYVQFSPVGYVLEEEDTGCYTLTFHFLSVVNQYIRHQDIMNVYSDPEEYVFEEDEEHNIVSNPIEAEMPAVIIDANRVLFAFLKERGVSRFDRTDVMETVE